MKKFSALFQPGNIGKMRLDNRLIMAPLGTVLLDSEGVSPITCSITTGQGQRVTSSYGFHR